MQALLDAIQANRADEVRRLLEAHPEAAGTRSPAGLSPLTLATYLARPALVELIRAHRGQPDFFEACLLGDEPAVRAHLQRGQDVNAYAPDGFTPLGLAAYFGHQAVARLLLQQQADVNACARNSQQVGPIHAAVSRNDLAMLELLLAHGADPDLPQQQLFRPLHVAAANGNAVMIGLLLLHGARSDLRTESGKLTSELARDRGHNFLADRLQTFEGNAPPRSAS
ncbi:MAG TPA: ankyrin repeat domain-containing protein [Steroidobacteraceae bacterium]|nr:ankyrin repeat domain-containing protein [Steroidobacteraceae bacterium]